MSPSSESQESGGTFGAVAWPLPAVTPLNASTCALGSPFGLAPKLNLIVFQVSPGFAWRTERGVGLVAAVHHAILQRTSRATPFTTPTASQFVCPADPDRCGSARQSSGSTGLSSRARCGRDGHAEQVRSRFTGEKFQVKLAYPGMGNFAAHSSTFANFSTVNFRVR